MSSERIYFLFFCSRKEKEEEKERLKKLKLEKKKEDRKKERLSCKLKVTNDVKHSVF